MDDAARRSPDDAVADALEQGNLQLLKNPEWSLYARYHMKLREQFVPAWVVTIECEHDQAQKGAGGKPEEQERDKEGLPRRDRLKHLRESPNESSESHVGPRRIEDGAQFGFALGGQLVVAPWWSLVTDRRRVLPSIFDPTLLKHATEDRVKDSRPNASSPGEVIAPVQSSRVIHEGQSDLDQGMRFPHEHVVYIDRVRAAHDPCKALAGNEPRTRP